MQIESPIVTPPVPEELLHAIKSMRAPIVISHVVPDADALGSMLALARSLTGELGKPKVSLPDGSLSRRLTFMFDQAGMFVATREDFAAADGFVVTDTAKKPRCNVGRELKETDWSAGRPVVNIDHHHTNTRFGDVDWIVDDAGSSCELVYFLLVALQRATKSACGAIDASTASLLYAGIQTDTVGFSLPTTRAWALLAAAQLVKAGADVAEVGRRLYHSQDKSEFDLLRIVYANTTAAADGQIAYSFASFDEIHNAGCSAADIDDQISVPRSLDGARLAMLFTEGNRGKTRINFRSSGEVTIADLAAQFKGGGHAQAAGAILDCGLKEAVEKVLPRAIEYLAKFSPPNGD
ncbi:MAG: DHH family phosphoesterase [Planctomycetes bacterium]|nr:DHH family phosphoesterase [Planctomycetota bacterium]